MKLQSKLLLAFTAVSVLMLVLVLGVSLVLARANIRNTTFASLEQKRAIAIPFVQLVLLEQRTQGVRPAVSATVRRALEDANLRVFVVERSTLQIMEDTGSEGTTTGTPFPFETTRGTAADEQLRDGEAIRGIATLAGEQERLLYIAQVAPGPVNRPGVQRPYVVIAQPEPSFAGMLRNAWDLLLPPVLIGLVASLVVAFLLARSISEPVSRLGRAAAAVSGGDYNQQVPIRGNDEIAALTKQFNLMAQQVGRSHQMQRDFVANVSHDLKTPLTSIQGFSQAMLDGSVKDEAGFKQAAGIINTEAQRMSRMVSQLLSLTQLQSGLSSIELRPTELEPLLGQLVLAMQPQAVEANVQLAARFGAGSTLVLADGDMLKQAFANLMDNAIKHTPSGGSVTVSLQQGSSSVSVIVADTGRGIPLADLQRVMERFYQVDKARSQGKERSLGLGLAIAHEIIAAHHGQVRIESSVGVGTSVYVTLPAATEQRHLLSGNERPQGTAPLSASPERVNQASNKVSGDAAAPATEHTSEPEAVGRV